MYYLAKGELLDQDFGTIDNVEGAAADSAEAVATKVIDDGRGGCGLGQSVNGGGVVTLSGVEEDAKGAGLRYGEDADEGAVNVGLVGREGGAYVALEEAVLGQNPGVGKFALTLEQEVGTWRALGNALKEVRNL